MLHFFFGCHQLDSYKGHLLGTLCPPILSWRGLARPGQARLGLVGPGLAWLGLAQHGSDLYINWFYNIAGRLQQHFVFFFYSMSLVQPINVFLTYNVVLRCGKLHKKCNQGGGQRSFGHALLGSEPPPPLSCICPVHMCQAKCNLGGDTAPPSIWH